MSHRETVDDLARARRWVDRIKNGDETAFTELFNTLFPRLVEFCATLALPSAVAEELAAEVFTDVWRRHKEWHPGNSIAAYFYRAVRNKASNEKRARHRESTRYHIMVSNDEVPGMGAPSPEPDISYAQSERKLVAENVWRLINSFVPERRQVAHLRWREGMQVTEIAEVLGVSRAAVQMQLTRIIAALRTHFPAELD